VCCARARWYRTRLRADYYECESVTRGSRLVLMSSISANGFALKAVLGQWNEVRVEWGARDVR
jgi:hypothetical protein